MSIHANEAPESWYHPDEKDNPCAAAWKRQYDGAMELVAKAKLKIKEQAEEIIELQNRLDAAEGRFG